MYWSLPSSDTGSLKLHHDATTFIATISELEIDTFPLKWHSGMGELGRGKTAQIQQSAVNSETEFAFKCFTYPGVEQVDTDQVVRSAMKEVIALNHPALRAHKNILQMHGVCWDVATAQDLFQPVLVVEKSSLGDLGRFMSQYGNAVDGVNRVELCADVIRAVANLHVNGS